MFSEEVKKLLIEVLRSWQVLAVTVVLIIYVSIVKYAARLYRRPSIPRRSKPIRIRTKKAAPEDSQTPVENPESDELGLEDTK